MSTPINAAAEAARESHRSGDGKFGSQPHSNPGQLPGLTGPEFEGVYGAAPVVATKRANMMRGTSIERAGTATSSARSSTRTTESRTEPCSASA